jgi:hypothetical protein
MVRLRSYARGGAVPLAIEVDTPAADHAADVLTEKMLPAAEAPSEAPISVEDGDASRAFQTQIDALRKSEQMQRGHASMSREEKSQHWRENGIGGDDLKYLHELEDNPHITVMAVADARKQGLPEDTQQFHAAVKSNFRKLLPQLTRELSDPVRELEAAYQIGDVKAQAEITDRISKANIARARAEDDSDSGRGRIVSAPVSRGDSGGGSYSNSGGGERHGRVTLSAEQKSAAAFSGISEAEYAKQLLRLRAEKAEGYHTGKP